MTQQTKDTLLNIMAIVVILISLCLIGSVVFSKEKTCPKDTYLDGSIHNRCIYKA